MNNNIQQNSARDVLSIQSLSVDNITITSNQLTSYDVILNDYSQTSISLRDIIKKFNDIKIDEEFDVNSKNAVQNKVMSTSLSEITLSVIDGISINGVEVMNDIINIFNQ